MGANENVEIARRVFAAWGEGRFSADLLDGEIRFETFMPDANEEVRTTGLDELAAFMQEWFQQWRHYRIVGDDFRALGDDKVLVSARQLGTGRQSGAEVVGPGYAILTIRRGKVVELVLHYDRARILEAARLEGATAAPDRMELVRGFFGAISRFDLDALLELTHPEVEFRSFFAIGETGEYHGHAGIRQYISDMRESWESLDPVMADSLVLGDVVLAVGTIGYRGKGSGVEARDAAGWLFRFRDDKMVLFRAFREPAKALEAVGIDY